MMGEGRLRQSVQIAMKLDDVVVRHRFVELSLPRSWVDSSVEMRQVLAREVHVDNVVTQDQQLANVIKFLDLQGCFFRSKAKHEYSLNEVKEIFDPIVLDWFATYYSHPLWNQLRRGKLNLNGFVAWVLHNYHVSRAAGKSGSRCAVRFPKKELRKFFRSDVLEEYWHCDAFYFVRHSDLSISDQQVKTYVPLPASLAFEQYTVLVAESDWLAHLFISYLQESSIRFYSDCQEFYRDVEVAYGLRDFFKNWTAHMQLDFEHGHAGNFVQIFDSSETISHPTLIRSLGTAWVAYSFLCKALDQILSESLRGDLVTLRSPIHGGNLDSSINHLCPVRTQLTSSSLLELAKELASLCASTPPKMVDMELLQANTVDALYCAMSYAVEHDSILGVGRLLEGLSADQHEPEVTQSASVGAAAIASFLKATAVDATALLFLIQIAIDAQCNLIPVEGSAFHCLEAYLKSLKLNDISLDRFGTLGLQWLEIIGWWASEDDRCPSFEI